MTAPPYMPMYWSDYDEDTADLSLMEHGAYLMLVKVYWQRQGPLPDDDERLARMIRATPKEWKKLRPRLSEFFSIDNGLWRHKRIDAEIARFADKSAKAKQAANKRHAPGGANAPADAPADAHSDGQRTQCHNRQQTTDSYSAPNGAADPDADLYRRGREVLGRKRAGAVVTQVKKHYGSSIPKARAAIERASERNDPMEYLQAIIHKKAPGEPQSLSDEFI